MFLTTTVITGGTDAARVGSDAASFLARIDWAAPTWDLFIILFFIIAVFLYGVSLGRDRIIVILMSIYMALAVISTAPFLDKLNASWNIGEYFVFKVTAFLGLFMLLFFLLSRSALQKTFGDLSAGKWWQVFLFSALHVGLLVSIALSFMPAGAVEHLAPITRTVFATPMAKFIWVVAPIASMALLTSEKRRA